MYESSFVGQLIEKMAQVAKAHGGGLIRRARPGQADAFSLRPRPHHQRGFSLSGEQLPRIC